jgi:hypothetical protein
MNKLFLACILFSFFISCKKSKTGNNNVFDPNKPSFRVGTKWTYTNKFYDANGVFQGSNEEEKIVVKDTMINGSKYYFNNDFTNFSLKSDGYYIYDSNLRIELLQYKFPASKSETYQYSLPAGSCGILVNVIVLNTDTSKIVSGKSYDKLYHYSTGLTILGGCQGNPITYRTMFNTKMGLPVYIDEFRTNNPSVIIGISELKSFTY